METFPIGQAHFQIPSASGQLELKTSAISAVAGTPVAVLCHPHPQYQGTMENKVVQTMVRAFEGLHIPVVRFNFRGVGESTGSYAHGVGELEDLYTVMHWVERHLQPQTYWLGGFSFGSWIATQGAVGQPDRVSRLLLIAPPVQYLGFDTLHPQQDCSVMIADQDAIVPAVGIARWVQSRERATPMRVHHFPDATHFFHGCLTVLRETIQGDFSPRLDPL